MGKLVVFLFFTAADYIDHAVLTERKCSSIYVVCMSIVLTIINPMKYYIYTQLAHPYIQTHFMYNICMHALQGC